MITEDYVSFKIAQLLEKKGFDEICYKKYNSSGDLFDSTEFTYGPKAPTQSQVMKWLREVHHYYIQVMLDGWALGNHLGYYVVIQKTDSDFEMMLSDALDEVFYKTPEEGSEAAIKYCLEHLI